MRKMQDLIMSAGVEKNSCCARQNVVKDKWEFGRA